MSAVCYRAPTLLTPASAYVYAVGTPSLRMKLHSRTDDLDQLGASEATTGKCFSTQRLRTIRAIRITIIASRACLLLSGRTRTVAARPVAESDRRSAAGPLRGWPLHSERR